MEIKDRANSDTDKLIITDRLLNVWWEYAQELRLGQLIICAIGNRDLFNIEDYELIRLAEEKFHEGVIS
jgi:hypothetical protein